MGIEKMGVRKTVWTASFVTFSLQILILQCTFLSAAHLTPMRSFKDTTLNSDSLDDYSLNKLQQYRQVKDQNKDENLKNEGVDTVEGTNGVFNTSSGFDCPSDHIECSDSKTCCRLGESCCPDVDGNGLMECCPIENLTDVTVQCCQCNPGKCCYPGLHCVVDDNGKFVMCDPDTLPILYRWMYRQYEAKQNQ